MTSRDALIALADRCEQATGPDRELYGDIHCAVFGWKKAWDEKWNTHTYSRGGKWQGLGTIPAYTASLDAALTLVPKGWSHGYRWNEKHKNAQAWCEFIPQAPFAPADLVSCNSGKCATPALALCAASLRARANMENEDG